MAAPNENFTATMQALGSPSELIAETAPTDRPLINAHIHLPPIADLKGRGVVCAEFIPLRNTPEVLSAYVHAVRDAELFVTAGTEHNTLDLLPIAPVCLDDAPIPDDIQEIFWEGAFVVAAHQHLMIQGQTCYVDAQGKPNADFESGDAPRIKAFRTLGETVIARFGAVCRKAVGVSQ